MKRDSMFFRSDVSEAAEYVIDLADNYNDSHTFIDAVIKELKEVKDGLSPLADSLSPPSNV